MCSCSSSDEATENDEKTVVYPRPAASELVNTVSLTNTERSYVATTNDFAFSLYRTVGRASESYVLSPISVSYVLSMLNNAADGVTRQELLTLTGFKDVDIEQVNAYYHKLATEAARRDTTVSLSTANALFVNSPYELQPAFATSMTDTYAADISNLDFNDTGKTLTAINDWSNQKTTGMVPKMLEQVDPTAVAYVLNALCFQAPWSDEFDEESTKKAPFTNEDGVSVQLPMMGQTSNFRYAETDGCELLTLPYGRGAFEMTVVLPKQGHRLADVMSNMDGTTWQQLSASSQRQLVKLSLPRFETSSFYSHLEKTLSAMGAPSLFTTAAEMPYFCQASATGQTMPVYVSQMLQGVKIEVCERGTKAAAVTMAEIELGAAGSIEPTVFNANHPFAYVISEMSTGAIFFIGQYTGQ